MGQFADSFVMSPWLFPKLRMRTNAGWCGTHLLPPCKTRGFFWVSVTIKVGSNMNFRQTTEYNATLKMMVINLPSWSDVKNNELILRSNLVKLKENICGGRFSSVLIKCISLWYEYCRSLCASHFINQGNNILITAELRIFSDKRYKDCFSLLCKGKGQKKNVPEDCTFLFQCHFELPFYPRCRPQRRILRKRDFWLVWSLYQRVSYEFKSSLARVWKWRFFAAKKISPKKTQIMSEISVMSVLQLFSKLVPCMML